MLVGIGGISRSGKTQLAHEIQSRIGVERCNVISLDNFTKPKNEIPFYNNQIDWEHPKGLDFSKLEKEIKISTSKYSHTIVEGFLIFYEPNIKDMFDMSIYLSISKKTFVKRKFNDLRWGKITKEYIEHIWQSHTKNGRVEGNSIDLLLDTDKEAINEIIDQVMLTFTNRT